MNSIKQVIGEIAAGHHICAEQCKTLLGSPDPVVTRLLSEKARSVCEDVFSRKVHLRALVEISSHCRNNCLYCGLRRDNRSAVRYRLGIDEILERCALASSLGIRTFVLQGGEDPMQDDAWVENMVSEVHASFPDCAITLSLGEKSERAYRRFRAAGARRYLLRHETFNPEHYGRLHPREMSRQGRLDCLHTLKRLGYQTGTGIMVGSPWQSIDNIVEDVLFIQDFKPQMIGIGPFVHHGGTPLAAWPDGSVELTLRLISIFRLIDPKALIPSTTALSTLCPDGRTRGILAGANVLMPNFTPAHLREQYDIYPGKACRGSESCEGLSGLEKELESIGYVFADGPGDYDTVN